MKKPSKATMNYVKRLIDSDIFTRAVSAFKEEDISFLELKLYLKIAHEDDL